MYWKCECGEHFEEDGSRKGYGQMLAHLRKASNGKMEGTHKGVGLYDNDDNQLQEGMSIKKAINHGYLEQKEESKELREENEGLKTVIRGKAKFIEIDFDYELIMLYRLTKEKFPDYDRGFSEWLTECIAQFYNDNPELGVDLIYKKLGFYEEEEIEEEVSN